MNTVDGTRLGLGTLALDAFAREAFGTEFERLEAEDRENALLDLLTALRVVADLDPSLDWKAVLARCDEFYPVRARARLA